MNLIFRVVLHIYSKSKYSTPELQRVVGAISHDVPVSHLSADYTY
jgi:hypothetical protein